jgi:hypothetical protein
MPVVVAIAVMTPMPVIAVVPVITVTPARTIVVALPIIRIPAMTNIEVLDTRPTDALRTCEATAGE